MFQFRSVQSLSRVWSFVTPWTAAHQASLSITNSWSLLKLMSIKSVMPPYNWPLNNMGLFHLHTDFFSSVVVVQSFRRVQLSATPWTAAHQASLSFTGK